MKQNLFSDDAVRLDILRQRSYSMRWASLPEDVIPLSSADPDFPPSQEILDTLHEYLNGGYMPYGHHWAARDAGGRHLETQA